MNPIQPDKQPQPEMLSLHQQIDAYRTADDLELPELALLKQKLAEDQEISDLLMKSAELDSLISAAMQAEVEIPVNLKQNLLKALQDTPELESDDSLLSRSTSAIIETAHNNKDENQAVSPTSTERQQKHRSFSQIITFATMALCLTVAAGLIWWLQQPLIVTQEELAQNIFQWTGESADLPTQKLTADVLQSRPLDRSIRLPQANHFYQLPDNQLDAHGVAYDVTPPGQRGILLYVLQTTAQIEDLPPAAPYSILPSSGGWTVGARYNDDFLYVLAVEGTSQRFQKIAQPVTPLAGKDSHYTGKVALILKP